MSPQNGQVGVGVLLNQSATATHFLELFQRFCDDDLPRNAKLRDEMVSAIRYTCSKSVALAPFSWFERRTLLPSLPEPWQIKVSEALTEERIAYSTIRNMDELSLQGLRPGRMINDKIVEGYLELIRAQGVFVSSTRLLGNPFSTQHPIDRGIDIDSLTNAGQAFIPINHHYPPHWTFARLTPKDRSITVEHFDSLDIAGMATLREWAKEGFPGIPKYVVRGQSPLQRNATDYGLFMLIGIRMMASGSQHLSQAEADEIMPGFRGRVLAEILAGSLDPTVFDHDKFVAREAAASGQAESNRLVVPYDGTGQVDEPIWLDTPNSSPEAVPNQRLLEVPKSGHRDDRRAQQICGRTAAPRMQAPKAAGAKARGQVKENPQHSLLDSFAQEQVMVNMLRCAVLATRAKQSVAYGSETLASLWNDLACEESNQHALTIRYRRERFSRMFFGEVERLGGARSRIAIRVRAQMEEMLHCSGDHTTWKAAQAQAAKAAVWTQLVNCVEPYLGKQSSVVLCGIQQSTTFMENMQRSERNLFVQGILARLQNPRDVTLRNLQAASNLYDAVTVKSLPPYKLAIEQRVDLTLSNFAAVVSLAEAPKRVRLPT